MQPELGDDTIHRSLADAEVALAKFLGDDFGAGFRIEEAVADDLADEFLGATVVGFRAPFGAKEGLSSFMKKQGSELEVTLTAETELGGGAVNALTAAFTLDEHGEFKGDFIVIGNGQGAEIALEPVCEEFQGNHRGLRGECHK